MSPTRISVIIPTLNEEESIPHVLAALPRDLVHEIIVVDNGSTDSTAEVAREAGASVELAEDEDGGEERGVVELAESCRGRAVGVAVVLSHQVDAKGCVEEHRLFPQVEDGGSGRVVGSGAQEVFDVVEGVVGESEAVEVGQEGAGGADGPQAALDHLAERLAGALAGGQEAVGLEVDGDGLDSHGRVSWVPDASALTTHLSYPPRVASSRPAWRVGCEPLANVVY